jgi:hypothetical protein
MGGGIREEGLGLRKTENRIMGRLENMRIPLL